jgi:serine/threonine protein kinase
LVKHFTKQILDGLAILEKIQLIHCDIKPENILLIDSKSSKLKLIDFGSACFENQTVYTYIQSRFYRSPEVIVGTPYNSRIDMWSLGCVAAELLLGLPLFPGHSEYDQMCRIVEMLGNPPDSILLRGKSTGKYFIKSYDKTNAKYHFELKSLAQYSVDQGSRQKPGKKYFKYTTLEENVMRYPYSSSLKGDALAAEKDLRVSFIDFLRGVLNVDHRKRWTPSQALFHPFITGEVFDPTKPFVPPPPFHASPPDSPVTPVKTATTPTKPSLNDLTKSPVSLATQQQQTHTYLAMQALGTSPSTSMMSKITSSLSSMQLSSSAPTSAPVIPTSNALFSPPTAPTDPGALLGISPSTGPGPLRSDQPYLPASNYLSASGGLPIGQSSMGASQALGVSPSQKSPYFGVHGMGPTSPYTSRAIKDTTTLPKASPAKKPADPEEDIFEFE